ncbi:MAG: hypothetical protein ACYSYL_20975 [Planctomycetota bacterium]|jgi:hypothetical protein
MDLIELRLLENGEPNGRKKKGCFESEFWQKIEETILDMDSSVSPT